MPVAQKHNDFAELETRRGCSLSIPHKMRILSGVGVTIVNGVTWPWIFGQWRDLPNELWAWKLVTYQTAGYPYCRRQLWVPSLLLFDFWRYKRQERSSHPSKSACAIDDRPTFSVVVAPRLFEMIHALGDSKLCRTCRLVCRYWAKQCSPGNPEERSLRWKDGITWYWTKGRWQYVPNRFWAWTFGNKWRLGHQSRWVLKLLGDPALWNLEDSSMPRRSTSFRSSAVQLPPELFKYICDAADGESWSFRLVCRYWNRLSTPHVLKQIDLSALPQRVRALWKVNRIHDSQFTRYTKKIDNVPRHDKNSKFPWLHLFTQTCASVRPEWRDSTSSAPHRIYIVGPFAGGHRTMRSVHFSLPRSLPRSLSRGIKELHLWDIHFRRFEDLTRLVCELPDLEELACYQSTFDSFPTEFPRRRPRTSRNRLKTFDIWDCKPSVVETPTYSLLVLTLYLSVYDAASFFPEDQTDVVLGLVKSLHSLPDMRIVSYAHNPQTHSCRLDFKSRAYSNLESTILAIQISWDPLRHDIKFNVVLDCRFVNVDEEHADQWTQLDCGFNKISGMIRVPQFLFGFSDRKGMAYFAETVLEKRMPSISRLADVRYSLYGACANNTQDEGKHRDGWYRASLDTEELLPGPPTADLAKVYS